MDSQTNQKITWTLLELTRLLEEEDGHVHFKRTTKHLALHPYHLINIQRSLNQILKSSLNNYDKELNGFVLAFKNPKLLSNFGELLYDSPFIHVDIEADFYLFRPIVGSFLKGTVKKKGLDHIVVLVHKIYTISIPKPDNVEEWIGDSVKIGQEIRCCVNQIDNKSKPPFICATLNSDYLQGCRLLKNTNIYNMENVFEDHNLNSAVKIEKANSEISEDIISNKERKKYKKSQEFDTVIYEDHNIVDSVIEKHHDNSIVKIEHSINEEDDIVSDKEKKKHKKQHKKFHEITSQSFCKDQIKAELSNNIENDIYRDIKCKINGNTDSIIESQNLNNTIIDTSTNQTSDNDAISEKEKKKYRKKHKKSSESDLESFKDKNKIKLNNTKNDINIKCEDNIHDKNNSIENDNLDRIIKIENLSGTSEDISDREKIKHQKKRKKSEIDTENEVTSDYLESRKKRKKTSLFSDSEIKTSKIKAEKFNSNRELKSPVKIKIEKV